MQYSKMLSLSFMVLCFLQSALQAKSSFSKTELNKKVARIEAKIKYDRYITYGFTAMVIAHEFYQLAPVLLTFFNKFSGETSQPVAVSQSTDDMPKEKKSMFIACKEGLTSVFYTKEGWRSLAQCAFSLGGYVMTAAIGEKFIEAVNDKFVHPDTLYWYINAHAPYARTVVMMQEELLALQDTSLNYSSVVAHKEFVWTLYNRLVHQSELICAYMMYKVKHLDEAEKVIGQRAVEVMINTQKKWLERIADQLKEDDQEYEKIEKLLVAYRAEIATQLNHFSVIEGETAYDRSVVKKRVKVMEKSYKN